MTTLREYLQRHGISQKDFGDRIGKTQAYVSKLSLNLKSPSPKLAEKIEAATDGEVPFWSWPAFAAFRPAEKDCGASA